MFPDAHCPTRWVENASVAKKALQVWPQVKKYLRTAKPLNTKAYVTLQGFLKDPLIEAKCEVFISLASVVEPFLKKFQAKAPLAPLLGRKLFSTMTAVMGRSVAKVII